MNSHNFSTNFYLLRHNVTPKIPLIKNPFNDPRIFFTRIFVINILTIFITYIRFGLI